MNSDEKVMTDLKKGDVLALEELYSRYKERVFAYLMKRLNFDESIQTFQMVWVSLIEKKSLYMGQPFAPWLYVLVRNEMIEKYRTTHFLRIGHYEDEQLQEMAKLDEYSKVDEVEKLLAPVDVFTRELINKHYLKGFSYDDLLEDIEVEPESPFKRLINVFSFLREKEEE